MATISRRISYVIRRVLRMQASAQQIAAGMAIGVFIAFTPTLGIQMVLAALVATLFNCSRLPAVIAVHVTNAFTIIPIYVSCYFVGARLLRPFGFTTLGIERIKEVLVRQADTSIWEATLSRMLTVSRLGWDALVPLWVGGLVIGPIAAFISYSVTVRVVKGHRLIMAERMARRAQARLARIRRAQAVEKSAMLGDKPDV